MSISTLYNLFAPRIWSALLSSSILFAQFLFLSNFLNASEKNALETDSDLELAFRLERAFQKVAESVKPSVVNLTIYSSGDKWHKEVWRMQQFGGLPPRENKFTGSGVIVDIEGTILTNEHVVSGARKIVVHMHDGTEFLARIVGTDPRSDLATLRPSPSSGNVQAGAIRFQPCRFADSEKVTVGQWALAIGNPFELTSTLTVGHISAIGRWLKRSSGTDVFYGNLIQTDAAINPGNSGGPLFNLRGEMIGINTMIMSKSGGFEGFGFAIPVNYIAPRLSLLKDGRPVEYGWLGVLLGELNKDQEAFKLPRGGGALIEEVFPDMPADRAGIRSGSIVVELNGQPVRNNDEFIMEVGSSLVGKPSKVKLVNREGILEERTVIVGLRSQDLVWNSTPEILPMKAPREKEDPADVLWRGMRVRQLPPEEASKAGGALRVVWVKKGSPAHRADLYEGAILEEVKYAQQVAIVKLTNIEQFRRISEEAKGSLYLRSPVLGYFQLDEE